MKCCERLHEILPWILFLPSIVQGNHGILVAKHLLLNTGKSFHLLVNEAQGFWSFSWDTLFSWKWIFTPLQKATGQKYLSLISAVILPKKFRHWQCYEVQLLLPHFGMLRHPLCPDRHIGKKDITESADLQVLPLVWRLYRTEQVEDKSKTTVKANSGLPLCFL